MDPLAGSAVATACHLMVETMPIPAVVYDTEQIVYANPALVRLLKAHTLNEVVGRAVTDFVHPDARAAVEERTRIITEKGAHLSQVENRLILCDGSELRVTLCAFPLQFGEIRLVGVFIEDWDGRAAR